MLTVTENAATVIKGLLTSAGESASAGLRIGAKGDDSHLAVEIAPAPESGDAVIEDNGARISGRSGHPAAVAAGTRRSDQRRQRAVPATRPGLIASSAAPARPRDGARATGPGLCGLPSPLVATWRMHLRGPARMRGLPDGGE